MRHMPIHRDARPRILEQSYTYTTDEY